MNRLWRALNGRFGRVWFDTYDGGEWRKEASRVDLPTVPNPQHARPNVRFGGGSPGGDSAPAPQPGALYTDPRGPEVPAVRRCEAQGCERAAKARGWCNTHYERWRRHGSVGEAGIGCLRPRRQCSVEGCEGVVKARGWCPKHYLRWRLHGDPMVLLIPGYGTGRTRHGGGYVNVYAPGHPLAYSNGWVLEHRKVVYDAGIEVPDGWHVHHINGDKTDNRLENLEVVEASAHHRNHVAEAGFVTNQHGTFPLKAAR